MNPAPWGFTTKRPSPWTGVQEHSCDICGMTFRSPHAARHHVEHVHPEEWKQLQAKVELRFHAGHLVHQHLRLHTSHLSQETLSWLCEPIHAGLSVGDYLDGYGTSIAVPPKHPADQAQQPQEPNWLRIPADLERIFEVARELECSLILLDPEAPTTEALPTFDNQA